MGFSPSRPIASNLNDQIEQEKIKRSSENNEDLNMYQSLEKCLRAIEESNKCGIMETTSLGLVSSLIIWPKFKVKNF